MELHRFGAVGHDCISCHVDVHRNRYGGDCEWCHTEATWGMDHWYRNHDMTNFPLTGMHRAVPCRDCHISLSNDLYESLFSDCYDCHKTGFASAHAVTENHDCIICHNTLGWIPVDMSNHDLLFPIYSGEHRRRKVWDDCLDCHLSPGNYQEFSCIHCHEHRQSKMDDEHRGEVSGYVYESAACLSCHPTGEKGDED